MHPPPPSSFQPPPSSLQHPQQYLNQNIARNWAISPNLSRKIKSCPFWLKNGTHGGVYSESRLRFLKFRPQNPPKIQNCPFCLEIGAQGISRMLILNPDLDFSNFDPKIHFCANLGPKPPSCPFCLMVYMVS